jgi:beta-phosphoglucomutase
MIRAVLFDFNGVIIDDERLQMNAYVEALAVEGIQLSEKDYFDSLGMDDVTFVKAAYRRVGREAAQSDIDQLIEKKSQSHRKMLEGDLPLFPGVVTFVKAVAREYRIGLVSMARLSEINYVLQRADLSSLFSCIVSAGDVPLCKPDPGCYRHALKLLHEKMQTGPSLLPEECLVIEDSPPGVASARSAGMSVLAVTNTVAEEALREAGAHVVTKSLEDWTVEAITYVFDNPSLYDSSKQASLR